MSAFSNISLSWGSAELTGREWEEFRGLSAEKNPEVYSKSLLVFGQRLESGGKEEAAARVYGFLATTPLPAFDHPLPQGERGIIEKAQRQLAALMGRGHTGLRAEVLLRQFTKTATDYRTILPMLAGSMVYQLTRTATLSRLLAVPRATWFNRGSVAKFRSSLSGMAFEVPVFSLGTRGLMELSGEEVPWDSNSLATDLAATAMTLGALKVSGLAGSRLGSGEAVRQSATFSGLLAAHYLEEKVGLRPQVDESTLVTDTLAAMVSLGVGAHLGHRLLGGRWVRLQQEISWRTGRLAGAHRGNDLEPDLLPYPPVRGGHDGPQKLSQTIPKNLQEGFDRSGFSRAEAESLAERIRAFAGSETDEAFQRLAKALGAFETQRWAKQERYGILSVVTEQARGGIVGALERFPELLEALEKHEFSREEKTALIHLIAKQGGRFAGGAYGSLTYALPAFKSAGFDYSRVYQLLARLTPKQAGFASSIYQGIPSALEALPPDRWAFDAFLELMEVMVARPRWDYGNPLLELPRLVGVLERAGWEQENVAKFLRRLAIQSGEEEALAFQFSKVALGRLSEAGIPRFSSLLFRFLKTLTPFNRKKSFDAFLSLDAKLFFDRLDSKQFLDYFQIFVEVFERWPRLGLSAAEGILDAGRQGTVPEDLQANPGVREKIFEFIEAARGFFPSMFHGYLKGDTAGFDRLRTDALRVLKDKYGLTEIEDARQRHGSEYLLALIHQVAPTSGASFVLRREEGAFLLQTLQSGDLREQIPLAWRDRQRTFSIPEVFRTLRPGKISDLGGKLASLVQKLRLPGENPGADREALVKWLVGFLRSPSAPELRDTIREKLYRLAAHQEVWRERLDRIDIAETSGLALLEELFAGRENLPRILEEVLQEIPPELFVQKGRRRRMGKKARGLIERLNHEWRKAEAEKWPGEKVAKVVGAIVGPFLVRDIQLRLLISPELPSGLREQIRWVMHHPPRISKNLLLKEILQEPLDILRRERANYAIVEGEALQIGLQAFKGPLFALWGLNAGVCTAKDLELWQNPNFKPLAITVGKPGESPRVEGFLEVFTVEEGRKKYLTLPGINPSPELLSKVEVERLYDGLMREVIELAQLGGYEGVYLPTKEAYRSNRGEINRLIQKNNYPIKEIPEVHWNTLPIPYPFSQVFILWEQAPLLVEARRLESALQGQDLARRLEAVDALERLLPELAAPQRLVPVLVLEKNLLDPEEEMADAFYGALRDSLLLLAEPDRSRLAERLVARLHSDLGRARAFGARELFAELLIKTLRSLSRTEWKPHDSRLNKLLAHRKPQVRDYVSEILERSNPMYLATRMVERYYRDDAETTVGRIWNLVDMLPRLGETELMPAALKLEALLLSEDLGVRMEAGRALLGIAPLLSGPELPRLVAKLENRLAEGPERTRKAAVALLHDLASEMSDLEAGVLLRRLERRQSDGRPAVREAALDLWGDLLLKLASRLEPPAISPPSFEKLLRLAEDLENEAAGMRSAAEPILLRSHSLFSAAQAFQMALKHLDRWNHPDPGIQRWAREHLVHLVPPLEEANRLSVFRSLMNLTSEEGIRFDLLQELRRGLSRDALRRLDSEISRMRPKFWGA